MALLHLALNFNRLPNVGRGIESAFIWQVHFVLQAVSSWRLQRKNMNAHWVLWIFSLWTSCATPLPYITDRKVLNDRPSKYRYMAWFLRLARKSVFTCWLMMDSENVVSWSQKFLVNIENELVFVPKTSHCFFLLRITGWFYAPYLVTPWRRVFSSN